MTSTEHRDSKTPPDAERMDLSGQQQRTFGPKPSRQRGLIWLLFFLLIVGVAGYAVWRAGEPTAAQSRQAGGGRGGGGRGGGRGGALGPVPVVVANVTRSSIPVVLNGLGNVTAFYTVTVKSRVDGQLMKVDYREGDLVKQGQVLA